ncbi:MAG: TlpA family protein disulfide reductase [Polyangiaceae bacterium]
MANLVTMSPFDTRLGRLARVTLACAVAASTVALAGCDEEAPPFPEGQGQSSNPSARYPQGPYGIEKGSVIQNYKFVGFPDPLADKENAVEIQLADFYNPSGDELYEAGSKYGEGTPKPRALLINIAAVWCGPCQFESKEILPEEYEKYRPRGAQFLLELADGPNVGEPAEFSHLVSWTTKYKTAWPSAIDPSYKLSALFEADAFPANILIDTSTMEIVSVVAGVPESGDDFFKSLDALLEPE